ncbi:MAG: hypothetical protein EBZ36_17110, partial [Acidobacteria bacterium]|nr:hypothetical protein [Acidobacteriota bacterium]
MTGAACEAETGRALLAAGNESLADRASIIPIQVLSRIERGEECPGGIVGCLVSYDSDVILGLERVLDLSRNRRIAAISLNVSNARLTDNFDPDGSALGEIIQQLKSSGIPTIASAESGGEGSLAPAGAVNPSQVAGFRGEAAELAGRLAAEGCFSTSDSVQGVSSLCAGDDRTYC